MTDQKMPNDALRRVEEELGADFLDRLKELTPEMRQDLRGLLRDGKAGKGGRQPGHILKNMPLALERMADLLLETPSLKERPAARQIGPPLGVSVERLRKCFAADRAALLDAARKRKIPPPPPPPPPAQAPTIKVGEPPSPPPGPLHLPQPPDWLQGVKSYTGEDFRRLLEDMGVGPNWMAKLKAESLSSFSDFMNEAREREEQWKVEQASLAKAAREAREVGVRDFIEMSKKVTLASEETRDFVERLLTPGSKTS